LPDFCEVYPTHGAGSLCGRAIGAKRTSTIGYEKRYNAALQIQSREDFVKSLTTNMPAAPDHFSRCSSINRAGPTLIRDLNKPEAIEPSIFKSMMDSGEKVILDVRSYEAFGSQFIKGSYSNDIGGNFAIFAGWVLPPEKDILLIVSNEDQVNEVTTWLWRIGLDKVSGYLHGGLFAWANNGLSAEHIPQLSADELQKLLTGREKMVLLDVRTLTEYERFHIEGSYNIPVPDLRTGYKELGTKTMIAVICSTGRRSSLGASILKQHNFNNIYNVAGGMTGYNAAGYGPQCPICTLPHGPRAVM
jgi:rhodanese-related sulfurtransferase